MLTPLGYEKFRNDYWEVQPLHIERADLGYFKNLLSEAKIMEFVQGGTAFFPEVQAINARTPVPVAGYTADNKIVCAQKLTRFYAAGATIVVSEVHKKFPALQNLCVQFSREFRMKCQANAYLSPAGNQGFHSHYDTHDVFVLQVAGRKKFRFYSAGIKLPFTEDIYTPENKAKSELLDEIEVSAGDTLYIPRGIVHDAIADEGESSLHITLGAFPFIARDLLQEMVQVAAESDVEWRSSVGMSQQSFDPALLYKKAENIFSDKVYAEAMSRLADEVALDQPTMPSFTVSEITLETIIAVLDARIYGVESNEGLLKLRLPGSVLSFEAPMAHAVEEIIKSKSIKVNEISGLDDEQKLALCRQLAEVCAIAVENTPDL